MNNIKGEWRLRDYTLSLLLLSGIIALAYIMVGSLSTEYSVPGIVDPSFSENYDRFNEQQTNIGEMWDSTTNKTGLTLVATTADILLQSTFSVISLIIGSVGSLSDQVGSIAGDFGIPTEVWNIGITILLSVLTILIIFAIINAVNKQEKL